VKYQTLLCSDVFGLYYNVKRKVFLRKDLKNVIGSWVSLSVQPNLHLLVIS
jgi:hypothetical protein